MFPRSGLGPELGSEAWEFDDKDRGWKGRVWVERCAAQVLVWAWVLASSFVGLDWGGYQGNWEVECLEQGSGSVRAFFCIITMK